VTSKNVLNYYDFLAHYQITLKMKLCHSEFPAIVVISFFIIFFNFRFCYQYFCCIYTEALFHLNIKNYLAHNTVTRIFWCVLTVIICTDLERLVWDLPFAVDVRAFLWLRFWFVSVKAGAETSPLDGKLLVGVATGSSAKEDILPLILFFFLCSQNWSRHD